MTTLIVVLWRHRLNFHGYCKPTPATDSDFRLVVLGPENSISDETCVDVYYQIQAAFGPREYCQTLLMQKVRELASNYGSTRRIIIAFEAELQFMVAKIRFDLGIEGVQPDQLGQVSHMKEMKLIARRNGLMMLRQTVISLKAEPVSWLERITAQLDGFPVFIKSRSSKNGRKISRDSIQNYDELQSWIKSKLEVGNKYENEFVVEECLRDGYEFVSLCSVTGVICGIQISGTIAKMNAERTLFECIRDQKPYAYEYLSVDQTRDILPGVESFALRTAKSLPALTNSSFIFIKGFYRNHSDIYLLGAYLQPLCDSHRRLIEAANNGVGWEVLLLNKIQKVSQEIKNGQCRPEKSLKNYWVLVNFPSIEGVLLHQTNITKRASSMRVVWKAYEGQELDTCSSSDDNILQIFLSNANRSEVMADVQDLISKTYIAVDRIPDKHSSSFIPGQNENHLIRSLTS